MLRRIEQASPIDRRSTKSRSSRFWERLNEMAQGMQNTLRNMYKTYGKYAGNGTKMNENRCPEASKEQVGGRTQCAKQRLKYLQNVPKIWRLRAICLDIWAKLGAEGSGVHRLGATWSKSSSREIQAGPFRAYLVRLNLAIMASRWAS